MTRSDHALFWLEKYTAGEPILKHRGFLDFPMIDMGTSSDPSGFVHTSFVTLSFILIDLMPLTASFSLIPVCTLFLGPTFRRNLFHQHCIFAQEETHAFFFLSSFISLATINARVEPSSP